MSIRGLYTPLILVADINDTLAEAAEVMQDSGVGALAVMDEGELVAMISERDLVRAIADRADPRTILVRDYASFGAVTLPAESSPSDAAAVMAALFVRHVPVTDHGQIVGILSARDLLDALIDRRPAVP